MVIVAVLSVPLGMMVSGHPVLTPVGVRLVLLLIFGCMGYLLRGWEGVLIAIILPAFIELYVLARWFSAQ